MGPRMGMGGMGMGGMGMGGGMFMGGFPATRETRSLAVLIATTIDPDSWTSVAGDLTGGQGSIVQYHELLVVKNSQTVHGKIKALLEMMRTSAKSVPGALPPGGPAPAARQ